jgi:hypothetical protein
MSDYAWRRALRMRLLTEGEMSYQQFLDSIHQIIGVAGSANDIEECDKIIEEMSDEEFTQLIRRMKLRRKAISALLAATYILSEPAGVM